MNNEELTKWLENYRSNLLSLMAQEGESFSEFIVIMGKLDIIKDILKNINHDEQK